MKYKAKIIWILILLASIVINAYSENQKKQSPPPANLTWRLSTASNSNDSASLNTIIVDSNQINYLNKLLADCSDYSEADSLIRSRVDSLMSSTSEFQQKLETGDFFLYQFWAQFLLTIIAVLAIIVLVLIVFVFSLKKRLNERIEKRKGDIIRLEEIIRNSTKSNSNNIGINLNEQNFKNLKKEIDDLKKEFDLFRGKNVLSRLETTPTSINRPPSKPSEKEKLLYADSIIDGKFSHVWEQENEDTIFVLRLENGSTAFVTIYKQAHKKILANPSYLEGCEKRILGNNFVEVVREGMAQKTSMGKWSMVVPLKVDIK